MVSTSAVHLQRANALGHHRLGLDVAAVGTDLHGVALLDAFLLRQLLADFHELLRLRDGVQPRVLGPVVEVLGQTIGGADVRNLSDLPIAARSSLNTRAAGLDTTFGCSGLVPSGVSNGS